ncbi:MAG: radical SAM protein [Bacillota bacterium]
MEIHIPSPISGGLFLTYRCSAACRHCMYLCGPKWPADWISPADLARAFAALAGRIVPSPWGPDHIGLNHGLHLSGGEPFLNYELLCRAVAMATEAGIPSLFVETNCFWCTDEKITRERLRELKNLGLKGILISVNPFYLEYVPFARTRLAVAVAAEIFGRDALVYQAEYYRRFLRLGIEGTLPLTEYLRREGVADFLRGVEFFLMGRAIYRIAAEGLLPFCRRPARAFLAGRCRPPFLRPWHNHFDNYGHFLPGYCAGLSLGDYRELDHLLTRPLTEEETPVLWYLAQEDLAGLLRFAVDLGYEEETTGYFSRCHLCLEIRRFLARTGRFVELAPQEFYTRLEAEAPGGDQRET